MRLLHIADLHLGKKVHEFDLLEDQAHALQEIIDIAIQHNVDGLFIAGDIFDKPIPSVEALRLWEWFLKRLAENQKKAYIISGNHDSGYRLSFGADFFQDKHIYFCGKYAGNIPYVQEDNIRIYLFPFVRPSDVKAYYPEDEIHNYQQAIEAALKHCPLLDNYINIIVCHQFISGAQTSDSEEISIGTLDQVSVDVFADFDYVALGHLHTPQFISRETVRYAGSIFCYSESEIKKAKSVVLLDIQDKNIKIQLYELHPLHATQRLRGSYEELTSLSFYQNIARENYYYVQLTDHYPIPEAITKLRQIYPNILNLRYQNSSLLPDRNATITHKNEPFDWLSDFYQQQNQKNLSTYQQNILRELLQKGDEE